MVTIRIYNKDNKITGFLIEGHACYDKKGQDIVCAAVSVLAQTALIGLNEFLSSDSFHYNIKDGYIKCKLEGNLNEKEDHNSQVILKTMCLGLETIQESYGSYVRILKEVY